VLSAAASLQFAAASPQLFRHPQQLCFNSPPLLLSYFAIRSSPSSIRGRRFSSDILLYCTP
jgi:hypothetical protein